MPAVSRDECFPVQRDLKRVQVFGELASVYRMEPIDSNRYGFVFGKIAFDNVVDDALQWMRFSHGISSCSWLVELKNTVSELFVNCNTFIIKFLIISNNLQMQWQRLYYDGGIKSAKCELKEVAMEVIAVLKNLREEKNWSQEDLAHELGVSFSTINRWENGKTKPSKMAQAHINRLLSQVQKRREK